MAAPTQTAPLITRALEARRILRAMGPHLLRYTFTAAAPMSLVLAWSEWMQSQTSRGPFIASHEHNAFGYLLATPGFITLAALVWLRARDDTP